MKAVIQRVSRARLTIEGRVHAEIGKGLLILLGVTHEDTQSEGDYLAKKCGEVRIFTDSQDKMNLSAHDVDGGMLVVSNFTLYADCHKGRRPAFVEAARPEQAEPLYEYFVERLKYWSNVPVETGVFGADMKIELVNDGPVTLVMDTAEMMK